MILTRHAASRDLHYPQDKATVKMQSTPKLLKLSLGAVDQTGSWNAVPHPILCIFWDRASHQRILWTFAYLFVPSEIRVYLCE